MVFPWVALVYHGYGGKVLLFPNQGYKLWSLPREWVMAAGYAAFIDESGKFQQKDSVSVGCVFSLQDDFEAFGAKWEVLLRAAGLDEFKASSAFNSNKKLSEKVPALGTKKRAAALLPFVKCIRKHLWAATGNAVDTRAFRSMGGHLKEFWHNDAFYCGFSRLAMRLKQLTAPQGKISVICDENEETAVPTYRFYRRVKRIDPEMRSRMVGISFVDSASLMGLQAADLYASLVRLEGEKKFHGNSYEYETLFSALHNPIPGDRLQHCEIGFLEGNSLVELTEKMLATTKGKRRMIPA
jgi:hypothetical protein